MNTKTLTTNTEQILDRICSTLSEYYTLGYEKLQEIKSFLLQEENAIIASHDRFVLLTKNSPVRSFTAEPKYNDVCGIYATSDKASLIPFDTNAVPNSLSSRKEFAYFLANTSNNNNNNNNNNS